MRSKITIGVLVPSDGKRPRTPPPERPIGRAALHLAEAGIDVIFGDTIQGGKMTGFRATPAGWEPVSSASIDAAHDRFPSQLRADRFAEIRAGLGSLRMGNSLSFTMLCRDKLLSQERLAELGVRMPEVEGDPARFSDTLEQWGSAFLKPRFGALGLGVTRVSPGSDLPEYLPGVVPDRPDPSILQRAIAPPAGWASRTVRVLVQKTPAGEWIQGVPVVRQSRVDTVANAARGAEVAAGPRVLSENTLARITAVTTTITAAMDRLDEAEWMLEAGLDLVLDRHEEPWLIEVNSRPRGRMEMLAKTDPLRYLDTHIAAAARPIQRIAALLR